MTDTSTMRAIRDIRWALEKYADPEYGGRDCSGVDRGDGGESAREGLAALDLIEAAQPVAAVERNAARYCFLRDRVDTTTGFLLCQRREADEWDSEIDGLMSAQASGGERDRG